MHAAVAWGPESEVAMYTYTPTRRPEAHSTLPRRSLLDPAVHAWV